MTGSGVLSFYFEQKDETVSLLRRKINIQPKRQHRCGPDSSPRKPIENLVDYEIRYYL